MDLPELDPTILAKPEYLIDTRPRLFALVADCDLVAADPGYDPARFDPADAMFWGLEFPGVAITYFRHPATGVSTFGTHTSAEGALGLFGRLNKLRLAYQELDQTVTSSESGSGRAGGTTNL